MLTVHEAYLTAKSRLAEAAARTKRPDDADNIVLNGCLEGDDFWYFVFGHARYDKNDMSTWSVGGNVSVNKKTGEHLHLTPTDPADRARLVKAVKVPVETVIRGSETTPKVAATRNRRSGTKRAVAAMA